MFLIDAARAIDLLLSLLRHETGIRVRNNHLPAVQPFPDDELSQTIKNAAGAAIGCYLKAAGLICIPRSGRAALGVSIYPSIRSVKSENSATPRAESHDGCKKLSETGTGSSRAIVFANRGETTIIKSAPRKITIAEL
jgi:hypothetical protein